MPATPHTRTLLQLAACPALLLTIISCTLPQSTYPNTIDLSKTASTHDLTPYLGHKITLAGHWSGRGKLSGFVYGNSLSQGPVYLRATRPQGDAKQSELENKITEGSPVRVTGILQYDPGTQTPPNAAGIPAHFYMDAENVQIVLPQR